jgi:hypothetical protein
MKNKLKNISHIFIICEQNKEKDRYDYLYEKMNNDFDSDYFTLSAYCYGSNISDYDLKKYNIGLNLNTGNKSLALNHIKIFEYFIQNYKESDNILILESDAIPVDNYKEILNYQMDLLGKDSWDFLDIGNGCGWNPSRMGYSITDDNNIYLCKSTRAAHSIVWSYNGVKKFLNGLSKQIIQYPIDYVLYQVILTLDDPKTYWGHPYCFIQGSQNKTYKSLNL